MDPIFNGSTLTFTTPSTASVTIREQNGADDDIISNISDASTLTNISRFLSGIILEYNGSKLTTEGVQDLPLLDKYCILLKSRIHSLGNILEFSYNWGENIGEIGYNQDLEDFLFDYGNDPEVELSKGKPSAIPFYPLGSQLKDIEFTSKISQRKFLFDVITGKGELFLLKLPLDQQTKNKELIARNLRLVNEDLTTVKLVDFKSFSVKEMSEIRGYINGVDPLFTGMMDIPNPVNPADIRKQSILGVSNFFFLGEA